jgi:hypothetical protein
MRDALTRATLSHGQVWPDPKVTEVCVPKTLSTSCDQVILVDQATDARPSSDVVPRKIGRLG